MKKFEINDRIIDLMKERSLDESQMAEDIGKDKSTIYRIISKTNVPTRSTVKIIADKYGVDYNYLLSGNLQQFAKAKPADSPWKEEAYATLKQDLDYLKGKYDQLFNAFLEIKAGKFNAFEFAGSQKNDRSRAAA